MSEYNRLTKKDKYGHWYTETKINDRFMWSKDGKVWERDLSHYAFDGEAIDRLAELEDKIENGTLVETPCKVNSTVYIVYALRVIESKVRTIFFGSNGAEMIRTQHYDIPFRNWGKTLFLTREEAEKALDDMKNEDENERLQDKNKGV